MDIKYIAIEKISPNDYNPNVVSDDILAKLRAEIAHKGLCEPILVRMRDGGYIIVDGEHRWRICRDLGIKEIPCIVEDYDDKEAKIKTVQMNYMRGQAVPIKLAHLIHDLNKEIKIEDLAKRLPYEKVHLMDNLELLKLPEDFGKTLDDNAKKEEAELPSVISFVVYREQEKAIEEALNIASQDLPEGAKNKKALALEAICRYFLETKRDREK